MSAGKLPNTWLKTRGNRFPPVEGVAGMDLSNADLSELRVLEPDARDTVFRGANLEDFRAQGGRLRRRGFHRAALNGALFFDTQMVGVKMSGG